MLLLYYACSPTHLQINNQKPWKRFLFQFSQFSAALIPRVCIFLALNNAQVIFFFSWWVFMHVLHGQIPRKNPTRINIGFCWRVQKHNYVEVNELIICTVLQMLSFLSGKYYILSLWCNQSRHSKGSLVPRGFIDFHVGWCALEFGIGCSLLHKERRIRLKPISPTCPDHLVLPIHFARSHFSCRVSWSLYR